MNSALPLTSLPESILSRISINSRGCWTWTGAHTGKDEGKNYGKVWRDKKWRSAHIVVYEILVGPVPKGLHLDHKCRCRLCVNPHHLEPVTPQENTRRGKAVLFSSTKESQCSNSCADA